MKRSKLRFTFYVLGPVSATLDDTGATGLHKQKHAGRYVTASRSSEYRS